MKSKLSAFADTLFLALGEAVVISATVGIYFAIGKFHISVLLGACLGAVVTVLNFLFLSIGMGKIIDEYMAKRPTGEMDEDEAAAFAKEHGARIQNMTKLSFIIRSASMMVCLILAFVLTDIFDVVATVIPLLLMRPILSVRALITKNKGKEV